MDVSFVIVNWNTKELLLQCLGSLIPESSGCEAEIIVVDNASTDGSADAVRKSFPGVKIICNESNLGFAKANNIGIGHSSGRYVCLVNSDIVVLKDCVGRMMAYMDTHIWVGLLGPKLFYKDMKPQPSCKKLPSLWSNFCMAVGLHKVFRGTGVFLDAGKFPPGRETYSVEMVTGAFWMLRRVALDQVGLLDEGFFFYGEDADLCKRLRSSGWDVAYYPAAMAIHYGGSSSSKEPVAFYREYYVSNLRYWRKHHGRLAQAGFILIGGLRQVVRLARLTAQGLMHHGADEDRRSQMRACIGVLSWMVLRRNHGDAN